MTSEELAGYVEDVVNAACKSRILGTGREQYSIHDSITGQTVQKVEQLPLVDVCDWAMEELQDLIVYAAALHLRFERLRETVTSHTVRHTYREGASLDS